MQVRRCSQCRYHTPNHGEVLMVCLYIDDVSELRTDLFMISDNFLTPNPISTRHIEFLRTRAHSCSDTTYRFPANGVVGLGLYRHRGPWWRMLPADRRLCVGKALRDMFECANQVRELYSTLSLVPLAHYVLLTPDHLTCKPCNQVFDAPVLKLSPPSF